MSGLAAVEATQSLEVLFALIGEMLILSSPLPSLLSWTGIAVIITGMALHSLFSRRSRSVTTPAAGGNVAPSLAAGGKE
jgi:hypothetical protein